MKYLRYFESLSGTSVMDIKDVLVDLIQNYFYVEVCLLKNSNQDEDQLEDSDIIKSSDRFHIYMCLEKLLSDENENVSFCWSDISDPITHLINTLSVKYKFDGCRANISFDGEGYDIHNVYLKSHDSETVTMSKVKNIKLSGAANMIEIDVNEKVIYNVKITFEQK